MDVNRSPRRNCDAVTSSAFTDTRAVIWTAQVSRPSIFEFVFYQLTCT